MTSLVIVESAAKSKTIQKYLNGSASLKEAGPFKVMASLGHIVATPPKELGIDTETWEVSYVPIKPKVIKELKDAVKKAKEVYLAADPDREGEAIAYHLQQVLKLKHPKRVVFHEITPKAIEQAIKEPRNIDMDMLASQETRVVLDKLVGFKISPLLWQRFAGTHTGLSAGRVQSVVLRSIVERFKAYEEHKPDTYWTVEATFKAEAGVSRLLEADLYQLDTGKKDTFPSSKEGTALLDSFQKKMPSWVMTIETKTSKQNPSSPYTTSALQQEVYDTFHIPAKQTMQIAQKLYEAGLITYMRTDSVSLSKDIQPSIKSYIETTFNETYYQERAYKSKVANAQEAHECIRPTDIMRLSKDLPEEFTPSQRKVYHIIWRKTVASQMSPAIYTDVIYHIQPATKSSKSKSKMVGKEFFGKVSFLTEQGYLKVWNPSATLETAELEAFLQIQAPVSSIKLELQKATSRGNITKPEGLYHEASIIKWMEREGIGRPSTYASIMDKLYDKGYVIKGSNPLKAETVEHTVYDYQKKTASKTTTEEVIQFGGKEADRLVPTALGNTVVEYLYTTIPTLMDYHFTANMEETLDHISQKKAKKNSVLDTFYQKELCPVLEKAKKDREEYRKNHPKEKTEKPIQAQNKNQNQIASFPSLQTVLLKTRYGLALYHQETKKYISVEPFLLWKKKEIAGITEEDVRFLQRFPITLDENTAIEYGRYGLYLSSYKKNIRLPKEEWEDIYTNRFKKEDILVYASNTNTTAKEKEKEKPASTETPKGRAKKQKEKEKQ